MEWISVKDRLPEYGSFCLLIEVEKFNNFNDSKTIVLGWLESKENITFKNDTWFIDGIGKWVDLNKITHWSSLPEPPKK